MGPCAMRAPNPNPNANPVESVVGELTRKGRFNFLALRFSKARHVYFAPRGMT